MRTKNTSHKCTSAQAISAQATPIKTGLVLLCSCALALLPAGCYRVEPSATMGWQPAPTNNSSSVGQNKPTAVESAIELSDKYARLSEETSALRLQKQKLEADNQQLKTDLQASQAQLEKARKELSEVNDLLVEMRVELNNWKTDVLGFRGEMRSAEKAQLEALVKILKLLGAEVKPEISPPAEAAGPAQPAQTPPPEEQK
jgi:septal ring factor EnvC (AmiA/AmiB activator)